MITYSFQQVARVNPDQAITVFCPVCPSYNRKRIQLIASVRLAAGTVDVHCHKCHTLFRWDAQACTLVVLPRREKACRQNAT